MEKKRVVESGFLPGVQNFSGNKRFHIPLKRGYTLSIFKVGLVSKIFMRKAMQWVVIYSI